MKTGVNTGTIINVKNSPIIKKANKKSLNRQKRASICIECSYNEEGFCKKYMAWAGRVNYKCLGIKDPYERKMKKDISFKKAQKKINNLSRKQIDSLAKRYRIN